MSAMTVIYLVDHAATLIGPVEVAAIPGLGLQVPSNGITLNSALPPASDGYVWALIDGEPTQVADHRGLVYRTDTGDEIQHDQLGALPPGLTLQPRPSPDHRWIAESWQIDPELRAANREALEIILCTRIDTAADAARMAVAGDPLRAVEYERAAIEAEQFAAAGYPADAVPRSVAAWAINGRTAQQAADSILAEAAAYTEALYVIRETRLAAKEQIRSLMDAGEIEQAQQLAEQTIASIETAVAGVGNAAA
ncbi:phage tail protein [Stutzerimonas urumqiensis]|uniref:hypothetical protein n=1 Tax=Stutzerimonas urumqiensis TaxID=638269 RepID=UPI003BAAF130